MKSVEIPIDSKTTINVTLVEEAIGIDEVVAVGYGTQKKSTMTGSVGTLKAEKIADAPLPDITGSLAGKVAGVSMTQANGQPGNNNPT